MKLRLFTVISGLTLLLTCRTIVASDAIELPQGRKLDEVDFDRHVVPLLSRFGCNAAACHGSFQGRGGMRLSLFGHQSAMDYDALSVRIGTESPSESLVLLKPTRETDHEGGQRFAKGSWPYEVMRRWIEQGGRPSNRPVREVRLSVQPEKIVFAPDVATQPLTVWARFPNNEPAVDVTPFCRFTSGDEGTVAVDAEGLVRGVQPGASHVNVEYLGHFASVLTSFPLTVNDAAWILNSAASDSNNFIDLLINDKLRELHLIPSPPASNERFLRRVTLDVIGRLPTLEEMHRFAADGSPDRRRRVAEQLLCTDRHSALWATRLCDMTRCTAELMEGPDDEKAKRAKMWHDWFRVRIRNNVPYNDIVRGVLCGTSLGDRDYDEWLADEAAMIRDLRAGFVFDYAQRPFLDLFWRRHDTDGHLPRTELAEVVSAAFLGIQVECAQCHKHPYDRWTQADYRGFVGLFSQVQFGGSTALNSHLLTRFSQRRAMPIEQRPEPLPRVTEVFDSSRLARPMLHPETLQPIVARPLGGEPVDANRDPREQLMQWMLTEGRMRFARNFVNRLWAHYFARGLVEPVDGFSAINPSSHPELLDRLATEFIERRYDIRHLELLIVSSVTYQRSSDASSNNDSDQRHFARANVRPLWAEVAIDVLHQALGLDFDSGGGLPPGATAIEYGGDFWRPESTAARMFQTFGRATRRSACDCDREREPSLRQSLFRMSDPWVLEGIRRGELSRELLSGDDDVDKGRLVFQRLLAREPTKEERMLVERHLTLSPTPEQAWTDIIWSLINTHEFLTNF